MIHIDYFTPHIVTILVAYSFASAAATISYSVTPAPKESAVNVAVEVSGIDVGTRPVFKISEHFGSASDFHKDLKNLVVTSPTNGKFDKISETAWQLSETATTDTLRFRYSIHIHQSSPGSVRFKPSLSNDTFYSNGYPVFIFPAALFAKAEVTFNVPKGWEIATSLQEKTPNKWVATDLDSLLASTIALGQYRTHKHTLPNGTPLTIAISGQWGFTDESISSAAFKIISSQIKMMGSWHFPHYLVVLTQSTEKGSSGSGLTNAFEMFGHPTVKLEDLYYVIAHENFHYWNGYRIRYEASKDRWFSEGFTDYFAFITLGRLRLPSLKKAVLDMSKTIQDYYDNPLADSITFADAGDHFWVWLVEYGRLAYSKGMLIALMMDVQLRADSSNNRSLLGFMKHLDKKLFGSKTKVNEALVTAELLTYSGRDWTKFLERHVLDTTRLPVNRHIASGGMRIATSKCRRADLGMTLIPHFCANGSPCGYRAENVTKHGPAFLAGIHEKDTFSHWEPFVFQRSEPNTPVAFGKQQPDGSVRWRRFTAETRTGLCRKLSFTKTADRLARQIRYSIWNR